MSSRDSRVDAYISRQKPFAQPILEYLRNVVHEACPDAQESIKWGGPTFEYEGALMCSMRGFKEHAAFGFWKGALIDGVGSNRNTGGEALGNYGRLTSVKDLPARRDIIRSIKQAMKLNEEKVGVPRRKTEARPEPKIPVELAAALTANRAATANFEAFSASKRRDYAEWIDEAKTEATKTRRVAQAVEWIAEGKGRNWKYER